MTKTYIRLALPENQRLAVSVYLGMHHQSKQAWQTWKDDKTHPEIVVKWKVSTYRALLLNHLKRYNEVLEELHIFIS